MTGPTDDIGTLLRNLNVRSHCKDYKALPTISYVIDKVEYTLEPEDYVKASMLSIQDADPGDDLDSLLELNNYDCIPAYMPLDI